MRAILLSISACLLGCALQVRDGLYSPLAVALLAACVALTIAALIVRSEVRAKWIELTLFVCVLVQLGLLFTDFPGSHHEPHSPRDYRAFLVLVANACAILLTGKFVPRIAFFTLVAIYLTAGIWLLRQTPAPYMDVFTFQQESTAALSHGRNPYAITFTDIYAGAGPTVYAEGAQRDGRLLFGFPYMPLVLEWNYLWHFVAPDYRYGNLIAIAIASILIADVARSRASMLAGVLLLFTPRGFFVIEQGWTEPLTILLLALTIWSSRRLPSLLPIALGLLLASKQYCAFIVPLIVLVLPMRGRMKFFLTTVLTACIVTLPFVLVDFRAFWNSAVALQFRQPFRTDALSFAAFFAQHGFAQMSGLVAIVAATVVSLACAWRLDRAFSLGVTVVLLTFFALNKQAFSNYYFLVIAAMCTAMVTVPSPGLMPPREIVR